MNFSDLPPSYAFRARQAFGCTEEEAVALWELRVTAVGIGLWRSMARQPHSLIRFLQAGHSVSAVFAVAKIFQRSTPDEDDMMTALNMGMSAAQAEEFDKAMPKYDRTLEDVAVFLAPELPREYAVSLV